MEYCNYVKQNYKKLFEIADGPIKEKLLMVAIQLKIFDYLTEPKTINEITNILNSHQLNTELFLNVLVSLNLIEKRDGMYSNSIVSKEILKSGTDKYLGQFLLSTRHWKDISLKELKSLILKGSLKQMDIGSEEVWEEQTRASVNYQRAEVIEEASQIVSSLPEYPNFKKMLDLGAGAGMVTISLVNNHPIMKGVIFDQPAVVKVAKELTYQYQLEKRIEVVGGDYMKDDIGSGYDLVWARLTFNFYQQQLDEIIRKVYDVLNEGGIFIYYGDGLKKEGTYPQDALIHMFKASLMSGHALNLSEGVVAQKMLDCGFKSVRSRSIMTCFGEMNVDVARK